MRLMRSSCALRCAGWATLFLALPANAAMPATTSDMTHLLTSVWAPATACGLALIAVFNEAQK